MQIFYSTEAIHQRVLLYYISVIAWEITKLLCGKVLKDQLESFTEALGGKEVNYITVVVGYLCY